MKAWQQFFGTTGTVGTWLGRGGGEGGATLQAPKRAGPSSSLKHAVCLAQLTIWPAGTTVSPCPVQSLHAVAKWSKRGPQTLLPNMRLRDMVKKRMRFKYKNCHHRNNVGQIFSKKKKKTWIVSHRFCFVCPPTNGRRSVNLISTTLVFCTPCKTQFGDHFSTTCGNLLATSLSSTLLHEPCSPNLALKIIICPGPPRTSTKGAFSD